MSTATSTQTSSTECPSTESSTTAADPVLTREEAIAILAGPDSELPELLKRAGALRRKYKGNRVSIHLLAATVPRTAPTAPSPAVPRRISRLTNGSMTRNSTMTMNLSTTITLPAIASV